MSILNFFFLNEIKDYLISDQEIINLISCSKLSYSFKNSIRFKWFPFKYYSRNITSQREDKNKGIPEKFKTINIMDEFLYNSLPKEFIVGFNILHVRFHFFQDYLAPGLLILSPNTKSLKIMTTYQLEKDTIPNGISWLELAYRNHTPIGDDVLPSSLVRLDLSISGMSPTTIKQPVSFLPNNLKQLNYTRRCNLDLEKEDLPNGLTDLKLGEFDGIIKENTLPISLKNLEFGSFFSFRLNQNSLMNLINLKSLQFGHLWQGIEDNKRIFSSLKSLKELIFTGEFNTRLSPGDLPESLEFINFGPRYNQPLGDGILPNTLKTLIFGKDFNSSLALPLSLEYLDLGYTYKIEFKEKSLPPQLKTLKFSYHYSHPLKKDVLPLTLKHLTFGFNYRDEFNEGILPEGLEYLELCRYYNRKFKLNSLPKSLRSLILGDSYSQRFECSLPESLETLILGKSYNQPFEFPLPKSLVTLVFGSEYNQPFKIGYLPQSLKNLTLGYYFDQPLSKDIIPLNLHKLELGMNFGCDVNKDNINNYLYLPTSLVSLKIQKDLLKELDSNIVNNIPKIYDS